MTDAVNKHLADILVDVERVRKACNDDYRDSKLSEDEIITHLSEISNALDDLYNEVVGI